MGDTHNRILAFTIDFGRQCRSAGPRYCRGLLLYGISYPLLSKYESGEFKDAISGLFRIVGVLVSQMHHFPGEVGK